MRLLSRSMSQLFRDNVSWESDAFMGFRLDEGQNSGESERLQLNASFAVTAYSGPHFPMWGVTATVRNLRLRRVASYLYR
jgi:hypothetical protein